MGYCQVPGWEIQDIDGVLQLNRSWKAKSFVKGLEILKKVADVAEAEGL
jgi:4a-hydroxytetrahydrobiopterin dehydratase